MKGIILAGGSGTRLSPITNITSKQLLPIYDKPMIYYPLGLLMEGGIRDIIIISTTRDLPDFKALLGNGSQYGINIEYLVQEKPNGIAESFIIAKEYIKNQSVCLILGDNIFYGSDLISKFRNAANRTTGATIFAYKVANPERYGVVEFDENGKATKIVEKPKHPKSKFAVTGLYFYDHKVANIAENIEPSARGELEITDVSQAYLDLGELNIETLAKGTAWLDTGTFDSLLEAGQYVKTIEERQGQKIACLEEIAYQNNYIDEEQLIVLASKYNNNYKQYLLSLIETKVISEYA